MEVSIKHWQDPLNLIAGLWMATSPWVLAYASDSYATLNAVILGAVIAAIALAELFKATPWEEWASVALGAWLVISPWVLGFSDMAMAMWNALAVGVLVAGLALWALAIDKHIGGWWHPAT